MSSAAKAIFRRSVLAEVAGTLDEQVDAARSSLRESIGGKKALTEHVSNLEGLLASAKAELFPEGADEAAQERAKLVITWLARAHAATENFADSWRNRELLAQGMVRAYEQAREGVARKMAAESAIITAAAELEKAAQQRQVGVPSAEAAAEEGAERTGPGPSIKQLRQSEVPAVASVPEKASKPRVSVKRARKG